MPAIHKGVRVQQTVRIPVDLHRAAIGKAGRRRWSLNEVICESLRLYVGESDEVGTARREELS